MSDHFHLLPTAKHDAAPLVSDKLVSPLVKFAAHSSAGGVVLVFTTIAALVWANSAFGDVYHDIFHGLKPEFVFGTLDLKHSLAHWINDLLMAVFFLLVGLEIKREILEGELSSPRRAVLPIAAALGGMIGPALIYLAINTSLPEGQTRGWGVPMATDIAFVVGVMAVLGRRVPLGLKVFVTSLAIADDLGALIVIAAFYTERLHSTSLIYAAALLLALIGANRAGFKHPAIYLIPGVLLWYAVFRSGVHATFAGVLLAMAIPARGRVDAERYIRSTRACVDTFQSHLRQAPASSARQTQRSELDAVQRACVMTINANNAQVLSPLHRLETSLAPWVAFFIIPVFALANAGVRLEGIGLHELAGPVPLGIIIGLFVGKPLGIVLACWIAVKLGIGSLPRATTWRHLAGAACLAGIGFTMAIFIANLAFANPETLAQAKLAILTASILSTACGAAILMTCPKPAPRPSFSTATAHATTQPATQPPASPSTTSSTTQPPTTPPPKQQQQQHPTLTTSSPR